MQRDGDKSHSAVMWQTNRENNTVLTPPELFKCVDDEFDFTCDPTPAGGLENPDVPDALTHPWGARVFLNPPYQKLGQWAARAVDQYLHRHCLVVMLIPVRTDASYWDLLWTHAYEVWFIQQRVCFVGYDKNYPVPLAFIVLRQPPLLGPTEPDPPLRRRLEKYGYTLQIVRLRHPCRLEAQLPVPNASSGQASH